MVDPERKLGGEALDQPGRMPPRVLKEILAEGSYCDDELGAECFGGVLASSRTEMHRDDRSAALASLIGRLSAYQLRTHFGQHALFGLIREDLLEQKFTTAKKETLEGIYKREFPSAGLVYAVSMHGIELFSKAHGVSGKFLDTSFVSPTADFDLAADV